MAKTGVVKNERQEIIANYVELNGFFSQVLLAPRGRKPATLPQRTWNTCAFDAIAPREASQHFIYSTCIKVRQILCKEVKLEKQK